MKRLKLHPQRASASAAVAASASAADWISLEYIVMLGNLPPVTMYSSEIQSATDADASSDARRGYTLTADLPHSLDSMNIISRVSFNCRDFCET